MTSISPSTKRLTCTRCGLRTSTNKKVWKTWNAKFRAGVIVEIICPDCQTVEEDSEAKVNAATVDYKQWGTDAFGRVYEVEGAR